MELWRHVAELDSNVNVLTATQITQLYTSTPEDRIQPLEVYVALFYCVSFHHDIHFK